MNYPDLLEKVKEIFLTEERFQMRKVIEEFSVSTKFLGDYYNYFIFEEKEEKPPYFYHVFGPYDVISKKDPQQAMVWSNGRLLLNIDFTDYVALRTGAMDSIVLQTQGIRNLADKKILIFGTGRTAKWSVTILKAIFGDLKEVHYINSKEQEDPEFEKHTREQGVLANVGSKDNINKYDFIFCHTNAKANLLTASDVDKIKPGAIITTYISSVEHGELSDEFFTAEKANIVIDWEANKAKFKELSRAVTNSTLKKEDVVVLKDLLSGKVQLKQKDISVFRFLGTPMQNLAVLKYLLENK